MNVIIPMAGMGKRMRPHTLTIPKPLIPVAGKPIVERLVQDIARVVDDKIEEIAFVIGDFGKETEKKLLDIASSLGAKGKIFYQEEALGTAHAILCAAECLSGKVTVAFADTLFKADFKIKSENHDGIIWVQKVDDPRMFGVVKLNEEGLITDFIEKPQTPVSDLAIIGIYYFKDGLTLRNELQYLIDHDIKDKGEYQLTNALENMKQKGMRFAPGKITEWLDCGNKDATVYTNQRVLEFIASEKQNRNGVKLVNSQIIEPCFIGDDCMIENSVIGPHVTLGKACQVKSSVISNSLIQDHTRILNQVITNSMIGHHAEVSGKALDLSVGDYNVYKV